MEKWMNTILYVHAIVGGLSLLSGALALIAKKGKKLHRKAGKVYVGAMTFVFLTGIVIAGHRHNRFLFLIAFLSYYSVFAGIRILSLKQLHRGQKPKWYDWAAGLVNGLANIFFIGLGIYFAVNDKSIGGALLSAGFGIGGLMISYVNLEQFVNRPIKANHWYSAHVGNMMGGYIATTTAFVSTINTRLDIMNPFLAFALPSLVGMPFLIFWIRQKR